jgi:hypothetical protein
VNAPPVTPAQLDHVLAGVQFFLGLGQWAGSKGATEWNARVTALRTANNEALVADLIPIIVDAININKPIVERVLVVVKKHSK